MEQANTFNNLDIIIGIAVAFGVINGFFKGFISQLIGLLGFFIAIWISLKFYQIVEVFIGAQNAVADGFVSIISLILTFAIAYFAIKFISKMAQKTIQYIGLGIVNRIAGAALGLVILLLLCSSILFYVDPILEIGFKETKDESILYPHLIESAEYIKNIFYETKEHLRSDLTTDSEELI